MTDRTERNKLFSTTKILVVATFSLILNYAFVIGSRFILFWSLPDNEPTTCFGLFKTSHNKWLIISNGVYVSILGLSGIFADVLLNK